MYRVGSVSFLNSKPLIEGLDREPEIDLLLRVPSALLDTLKSDQADVALLPVIDYQRAEGLRIMPAGGIVSDGPTLTVRIFSRVPIGQMASLACDPDSHTSVALARIILAHRYNVRPEFCDLTRASDAPAQARLLIGDKVVTAEPKGFDYQLDLGQEWKAMTGLPFVFATWMAKPGIDVGPLHEHLRRAKERGRANIDSIITRHAVPLGWPVDLARQYLTKNLQFDVGSREIEAIETFHTLAARERLIETPQPLRVFR